MLIEFKGLRGTRVFLRPESVDAVNIQDDGHAFVYSHGDSFQMLPEEAERLVAVINAPAGQPVASPDEPEPDDESEIDLEAAGYDGMGGTPWEGSEDEDDDG